jgi:hypothetical protein
MATVNLQTESLPRDTASYSRFADNQTPRTKRLPLDQGHAEVNPSISIKGKLLLKRVFVRTAIKMHKKNFENFESYKNFISLYDNIGLYEGRKLTCVATCRIIELYNLKILYILLLSTRKGYERKGYGTETLQCLKRYAELTRSLHGSIFKIIP